MFKGGDNMYTRYLNKFTHSIARFLGVIFILSVLSLGLYHFAFSRSVDAQQGITKELSFKSVCVTPADTLWSIARENYTEEYGSLQNYIKEIKRCNSLTTDNINAGSSLLVPIYVPKESSGY